MQYWTLIEATPIPGSADELRLVQRGAEFAINLGRELLMGSRMRGSEEALARLGCAHLAGRPDGRVLVGGFGMGFTLRAALDVLGPAARVEVAELVPAVLAWGRGPTAHVAGHTLDDPRVAVHAGDVAAPLRAAQGAYDAILLDVDNGPEGLTHENNAGLYGAVGLRAALRALKPGGVLAVWSAFADANFSRRLAEVGFRTTAHTVRAHGKKGARHTIWVAARPG